MKRLLLAFLFIPSIAAFAQRNVDLELTVTSPQDGEYIPPMQSFQLTVSVTNAGATDLLAADSVVYYMLMDGDTITFQPQNTNHFFYSGNELQTSESFSINRPMGFDVSFDGMDVELCVFVKPYSLANPVSDSILGNNTDCVTIHVSEEPAGLDEGTAALVSVYPNPAAGQFIIDTKGAQLLALNAVDSRGRRIELAANSTIDCSALANGVYQLEILTSNGKALKRLVINNP
ncbi:MAG TPA: T9SS type A sorting domain-containing protein [Fluviicola sp.]|nr:T9SS type A sorting domain-containing protein [Fluviicola sp.]